MSVVIGLDIGTTGARALEVNSTGAVLPAASAGCSPLSPRPGWSEEHPKDWSDAARRGLGEVAASLRDEVVGVALTGQIQGAVLLDSEALVIRPALLWNDQRTEAQRREITKQAGRDRPPVHYRQPSPGQFPGSKSCTSKKCAPRGWT